MPRTTAVSPELRTLLAAQDRVVTRSQLVAHGFSKNATSRRIAAGVWQRMLPGVVLTVSGDPTRRQRLVAASLWAGAACAVDGADACAWYGVTPDGFAPSQVHLVVPFGSPARSQSFVVVRRAVADIRVGAETRQLRYVDPPTAFVVAARGARTGRSAIALLSRGLQTAIVDVAGLHRARSELGDKWCRPVDAALAAVGVGIRSPAEADARDLVMSSRILPEPLWNQWVDLGDGGSPLCLDALWTDAGFLHEVNGRKHHAWGMQFDDMQARHDRLTASGLIAMHNGPTRIRRCGPAVLGEIERGYLRYAGRGMPPGVRLLPPRAIAAEGR